jgi:hypothetical protein
MEENVQKPCEVSSKKNVTNKVEQSLDQYPLISVERVKRSLRLVTELPAAGK